MTFLVFLVHAFVKYVRHHPADTAGCAPGARYVGVVLAVALLIAIGVAFKLRALLIQ